MKYGIIAFFIIILASIGVNVAIADNHDLEQGVEVNYIKHCISLKDDIYAALDKSFRMQVILSDLLQNYANADLQLSRMPIGVDEAQSNIDYWYNVRQEAARKLQRAAESGTVLGNRIKVMKERYDADCKDKAYNPALVAEVCALPDFTNKTICTHNKF